MVLGLLAVSRRPLELTLALEAHGVALGVQQVLGVQAGFDALGQVDFLLGVQQTDATDLLEIILDRVRGRACGDDTAFGVA